MPATAARHNQIHTERAGHLAPLIPSALTCQAAWIRAASWWPCPIFVGGQVLVDNGDPAGCGWAGVTCVAVVGRVKMEHGDWSPARGSAGQHGNAVIGRAEAGDGMPDRSDLHGDEVIELVSPVRGGG